MACKLERLKKQERSSSFSVDCQEHGFLGEIEAKMCNNGDEILAQEIAEQWFDMHKEVSQFDDGDAYGDSETPFS